MWGYVGLRLVFHCLGLALFFFFALVVYLFFELELEIDQSCEYVGQLVTLCIYTVLLGQVIIR